MADIVLAMSPEWLELILSGRKTAEFRRALPGKTEEVVSTRLLRRGDRVKLAGGLSRKIARLEEGVIYEVKEDESVWGTVEVWTFEHETYELYPYGIFELVTPVEELEPYSVVDAHTHWDVADKDMKTVVTYSKLHHPNAKAAAEAERDRLNSEYRKEVGTEVPCSEDGKEENNG